MMYISFDIKSQVDRYNEIKDKIKNKDFYQRHNFYILPFMPEKFRGRVVFFPEKFEPEAIYKKHKHRIEKLEKDFNNLKDIFYGDLKQLFPNIDKLEITISPSLYGTVGSYTINNNLIYVYPRYDREVKHLKNLSLLL